MMWLTTATAIDVPEPHAFSMLLALVIAVAVIWYLGRVRRR